MVRLGVMLLFTLCKDFFLSVLFFKRLFFKPVLCVCVLARVLLGEGARSPLSYNMFDVLLLGEFPKCIFYVKRFDIFI